MNLYNEAHKANLPKEKILELYDLQKLTTREVAKYFCVAQSTLRRYMKKYNIQARHGNAAYKKRRGNPLKLTCFKDELYTLHQVKDLTTMEIGKIYGVSPYCVQCTLRRHNIKSKQPYRFPKGHVPWNKGRKNCFNRKTIRLMSNAKKGKHLSPSTEFKEGRKELDEDKTIRLRRVFAGLCKRPTQPEKILAKLIKRNHLPYIYNGFRANLIVGGRIPDFFNNNGDKTVIEIFGKVFHDPTSFFKVFKRKLPYPKTYDGTIEHYKKHGFNCIILWEDELLSENMDEVLQRLTYK